MRESKGCRERLKSLRDPHISSITDDCQLDAALGKDHYVPSRDESNSCGDMFREQVKSSYVEEGEWGIRFSSHHQEA